MARPSLTAEQRRKTRQAIRNAASELSQKNGVGDVTARAVAEAAGVSVGTLYSYFDNLTELMQSLWKEPVKRLIEDLDKALAEQTNPTAKLRVLLATYARFARERRGLYSGAFMFVRPESHPKPQKVALEEDRFFGMFREVIMEGQTQKLIRSGPPNLIAQTLWSGLHGAIALPINLDRIDFDTSQATVDHMIDMLLDWATV